MKNGQLERPEELTLVFYLATNWDMLLVLNIQMSQVGHYSFLVSPDIHCTSMHVFTRGFCHSVHFIDRSNAVLL